MNLASLLGEFKAESFEHLEQLGSGLLAVERDPSDAGLIRKLFMSAHTIKGGASMLELKALKSLTHAFEDVLVRLRDGEPADPATVTLLLQTTDEIRDLVEHDPALAVPGPRTEALIRALQARARGELPEVTPLSPSEPAETPSLATAVILEPSETARLLLRLQLEARGWQVMDVMDEAGLRLVASGARLAVLPLEPGGVNGLELAARLRAAHPGLEMALSALEFSPEERARAEMMGVNCVPLTSWRENPWGAA